MKYKTVISDCQFNEKGKRNYLHLIEKEAKEDWVVDYIFIHGDDVVITFATQE